MKNTDNKNHDIHNLWHHFGQFNWDDNTRWWAQIAGDCVDLNTENRGLPTILSTATQASSRWVLTDSVSTPAATLHV